MEVSIDYFKILVLGKSTFIEKLGKEFITNPVLQSKIHATSNHRVAVLPIDPSSSMTGGSILGDKTRMGFLATTRDAFVRPAASRCILGGLAEHSRDVIALCEAAGYNIVVVETVGLGQSEIDVDLAVDMVILLVSPGGGDSLQAAKKGIMEIADLIVVNKADGTLLGSAKHTAADYSGSLQFLRQKHSGSKWRPQVILASALTDYHIAETAEKILHFFDIMRAENRLKIRRQQQDVHWLQRHIQRGLLLKMQQNKLLQSEIRDTEKSVFRDANIEGNTMSPRTAAFKILQKLNIQWDGTRDSPDKAPAAMQPIMHADPELQARIIPGAADPTVVFMGSAISSFRKIDFAAGTGVDDHGEEKKIDDRRRNSLAFYISEFVLYDNDKENDNYKALIDLVKNERKAKHASVRPSKFSKLADTILHGNMKELRNQVIVHWPNINRKYKDHHFDNSLLHMACQEGYYAMLLFMGDKHNHSEFDDAVLDFTAKNMRDRTPLFLCFTPPTATYCGLNFGLDNEGNSLSEKPDDIEKLSDWIKPGGPRSRENCIRYLIDKGANVNEADYHDFTCLHYATMWGWPSTVKLLLDSNADINAVNIGGKTALMMAVEYEHDNVLTVLSKHNTVQLDIADSEGYTALLRAAEKKDSDVAVSLMKILLEAGADPNAATIRRKTALKMACQQQDMVKVHLLFDYKVTRRNSAIDLLADKFKDEVGARMKEEEKKRIQMEKLAKAAEEAALNSYVLDGNKDPRGKWLEFRDKESKSGQPFYYNTVTRKCTKEKPRDFKPDNTRLVPDAIYGLNFYH